MKCFEKIYDFSNIIELENESSLLISCSDSKEVFGGKNNAIPPQKFKEASIKNFWIKKTENTHEIIISNGLTFSSQNSTFFWDSDKKNLSVVRMEEGCNESPVIHAFIFYQIEKSNKKENSSILPKCN